MSCKEATGENSGRLLTPATVHEYERVQDRPRGSKLSSNGLEHLIAANNSERVDLVKRFEGKLKVASPDEL